MPSFARSKRWGGTKNARPSSSPEPSRSASAGADRVVHLLDGGQYRALGIETTDSLRVILDRLPCRLRQVAGVVVVTHRGKCPTRRFLDGSARDGSARTV